LMVGMVLVFTTSAYANSDVQATKQLPVQIGVNESTEADYLTNYEEVASNSNMILYADMKKGLFALENCKSGDIWYSTPNDSLNDNLTSGPDLWALRSQMVISYLFEEDVMNADASQAFQTENSQLGCIESGTISVEKIKNGILVKYGFPDLGITIPVEYLLGEDYLSARIDIKAIKEEKKCFLTDISLLPSFGAGNWDTDGQLLIPDGSGALIEFNNGKDCLPYESPIYGSDKSIFKELDSSQTEAIRMPVFATIMKNKALMGVVTQGDGSTSIRAYNGNADRGYNAVSSKLNLCSLETLTMFKYQAANKRNISRLSDGLNEVDTYEVRYYPLTGEGLDYVNVAEAYRNYLIKEKGLTAHPQKPSLSLELYGSIDVKAAFLGFEYSKQQTLTTFKQAQSIMDALRKKGVSNLTVQYLGWGNNGLLNKQLPNKANPLSNLGGQGQFKSLVSYMDDKGYALYPDVDFMQYRSGSNNTAVKNLFNAVVYRNERLRSVYATRLNLEPVRLLTPQNILSTAQKYLSSYKKLPVIGISMASMGDYIYSNNAQNNSFHRYFFPSVAEKVLSLYKKANLDIALEDANAYAIPYASRIYNAPTLSSGYDMFDKEIPFYQIVTHGYVTSTVAPMAQSMEPSINILKAVESGSELLYGGMYADSSLVTGTRYDNLYSTQYTLWIDEAASAYKRYQPFLEKVYNKAIIEHKELMPNVMMTVFEGGNGVIVNYNQSKVTVDGRDIGALDYLVLEGVGE
jgi:hypothetical protein